MLAVPGLPQRAPTNTNLNRMAANTAANDPLAEKKELIKNILMNNFVTTEEELLQFKQNDEKSYEEDDE